MSCVSVLAIAAPDVWMGLFSRDPAILAAAAGYLAVVGLAYPFVAVNTLMSAFQATRQPEWPLAAMACRLLVVVLGGWVAIEVLQAGLVGLGLVTALGLASWGIVLADLARHIAHAHQLQNEGADTDAFLQRLLEGFQAEIDNPTDEPEGEVTQ